MNTERKLSEAELLAANVMDLSESQMAQRSMVIRLRKEERELILVDHQNQKFQQEQEAAETRARAGRDSHDAETLRIKTEQAGCRHMTGGEGRGGWFNGDGALYGSSTAACQLPTGEVYYLCFRCQREWHHPSKRDVLEGKLTLEEYFAKEKEYDDVMRLPRKSFAALNGEIMAASLFHIPALIEQRRKDDLEFSLLLQSKKGVRC
jgi:hypothetical protein